MRLEESVSVQRARQGDKEAFRHLVETYQDRLFGLVLSMVTQRQTAEDLLQEIFVKAYFALETFGSQSAFYTWLYRIASNHCLDHLRKKRYDHTSLDQPLCEDSETRFQDTLKAPFTDHPDLMLAERSESQALLGALAPSERLILTLRELDGRSYEEIAQIMDCPVNTVKSRLNRAREALKKAYDQLYGNVIDLDLVVRKRENR